MTDDRRPCERSHVTLRVGDDARCKICGGTGAALIAQTEDPADALKQRMVDMATELVASPIKPSVSYAQVQNA